VQVAKWKRGRRKVYWLKVDEMTQKYLYGNLRKLRKVIPGRDIGKKHDWRDKGDEAMFDCRLRS
jgi:hypothetical protein